MDHTAATPSSHPASFSPVPCLISDDFESGEMFGWESYPYAQDIGYEPFTVTRREPAHNGSKYSLASTHRANDAVELRQGFTKEVDLWSASDTRMKLALFLITDRRPMSVELSLCLFDGRRFFHSIPSPDVNDWLELDIPLGAFTASDRPLGHGEHVQAVTIEASYPAASHLLSYTLCLDDFSLNGERPRRFGAQGSASTTFELCDYSVLHRHFFYGDPLDIAVLPEDAPGLAPLSEVTCSLIDPAGKTAASGIELSHRDGAWAIEGAYTFREGAPRGQWTVSLTGRGADGSEMAWGLRFLMPGQRLMPADHPRLFFSREELASRLASQSSREQELVDDFIGKPEDFVDVDLDAIRECENGFTEALTGHRFCKVDFGPRWSGPIRALAGIAKTGALRYAFTGDEQAGLVAREALLKLCAFKRWNHPWQLARGNHTYYPVGYTIGSVGIGYDLLYPLLSEADKKAIRDGLMEKGISMFYRDLVEMNRMPSTVTNHLAVIVANVAVAATAILGEDPDNPCLEPYLSGALERMKRFIDRTYYPDGSYGEPIGYEGMATRDIVEALHVLERNFGIDYTTTTHIKDMYLYPLRGACGGGQMADFGDVGVQSGWDWGGTPMLWLTYRTGNPWTAHYSQPALESGRGDLHGWLWYTTGLETRQREKLTPSHHFPVKGTVFMRSDWSDEAARLTFKCGPNSNHYHLDQGTFFVHANGELLLSEAGLERVKGFHSYYANLYYPAYDTQAAGHNALLIDGDPESQTPADYHNGIAALRGWPRILHSFAGWRFDDVEADLACVYKGKLTGYTRSFVFIMPDIIVMHDRVRSANGHSYSWLFHAEDSDGAPSISAEDTRIRIERPKAYLDMDVLSPAMESVSVRAGVRDESFLQLTSASGLREADLLAVMVPSAGTAPAERSMDSRPIAEDGWIGARIARGESVIRVFFRLDAATDSCVEGCSPDAIPSCADGCSAGAPVSCVDGCSTDATRFAVQTDREGAVTGFFLRGSAFSRGAASFSSSTAVAASVVYTAEGVDVEVDAPEDTDISVGVTSRPDAVAVDGKPVVTWAYDAASCQMRLSVQQGHALVTAR